MTIYVECDFETRSLCDLKLCGAERYSEDASTEVLCLVYGSGYCWTPDDRVEDSDLYDLARNPDVYFVAHNAAFEQAIWRNIMVARHGFPPIPVERWDCTMAACAWKGLPLALDKAQRALRLSQEKDKDGNKLTLSLSKLDKKTGNAIEITETIRKRVIDYCAQDVVVEDEIKKRVGLISKQSRNERRIWELDQTINQRGVRLDMEFVNAAQLVVERASGPLRQEFQDLTGLAKVGSPRLIDWIAINGTDLDNLQKKTLAKALEIDEDDPDPAHGYDSLAEDSETTELRLPELSAQVRRVLEIRQMLGGAAVKKLKRMQACVGFDGRARGLLQYHAAHSGRWGGRLLQPQNFPRDTIKGCDPERAVAAILSGDPSVVERDLGLPALEAVSRSLRHALVSGPGKVFLVGDYAQIEARIVLALAGQHDKTALMAKGEDVYVHLANTIAPGTPRQAGKAGVLGLGFQCGASKFQYMAEHNYGVELAADKCEEIVETYRKEWAPKVPPLWYALHRESLKAVENVKATEAYGIVFKPEGEWLTATLPNQWQKLWYYAPRIGIDRFGEPCWQSMQSKQGKWIPVDMYGGLETENVVQALARGLMCAAMLRLEAAGFPVVLTVHDEIVCEVPEDLTDLKTFETIMAQPTAWSEAMGIPIAVEAWAGGRYKK